MTKSEQPDLIEYYRQRLERAESEYQEALDSIQDLKISHEETHKLKWEVFKRSREVMQLQQALGDFQTAVFEERKRTLQILSENDQLKIQELKDRKKIRFLLSLSGAPEEEVTYFRDRLDKRLIKIARASGNTEQDEKTKQLAEEQDLIILEDEVEGLKLTVLSLKAQLEEEKSASEATINGLLKEKRIMQEEGKTRQEYHEGQIKELLDKLNKMRALCRENTRELLRTKKICHSSEKKLIEEKAALVAELKRMSQALTVAQERNENVEKIVEKKITKTQDTYISDLRMTIKTLEDELRATKTEFAEKTANLNRKVEYFKTKFNSANNKYEFLISYVALQRRRDYEIEGFTNDIISLRQQLRTLEKSILKYSTLEDKELVLLNMARLTGERAGKISDQLQSLKVSLSELGKDL